MNRRHFLTSMLAGLAAAILPVIRLARPEQETSDLARYAQHIRHGLAQVRSPLSLAGDARIHSAQHVHVTLTTENGVKRWRWRVDGGEWQG